MKQATAIDSNAIRRRAYEIWERAGRPHGEDQAHWFEAQAELAGDDTVLPRRSETRPGATLPVGEEAPSKDELKW